MKRIIIIILGIALLVGLGIFTSQLISKKGKSDEQLAAFNFEIKDTASVNKIIITEPNGMEMTLVRNGSTWTDDKGQCVQPVLVFNILEALYNVRFKGYIPENSMKTVINRISTLGIKVQYFQNDNWSKTWYIGGSTSDHHGTYMLIESAEAGKSDLPVIAEIKGMKGIIEPRFFADPRKWQCSGIFAYQMEEIAEVNVKFTGRPDRSFEVRKIKKDYLVKFGGKYLTSLDTNMVYRYLLNFKRINFENPNYELNDKQLDSLKRSTPFCELKIRTTKGEKKKLRMFRIKATGDPEVDDFGDQATYDINRFWCELPDGQVVKCQYFVFNPLIMGHIYFNPNRYATTQ
ncbi:hypothetical protein [Fluviicola chungangensis]|uniref:DUF4340 domain-containing protein n=1 Tax=Fluviicola chungangensis TaxID=2597671 RepID=A0A556MGN8_9FLAO|nr:hypothetical protein [Fluviicola chungangensis]TSJ39104.1 hypothetical protein FO442_18200 [Fluviicola chungangensis]